MISWKPTLNFFSRGFGVHQDLTDGVSRTFNWKFSRALSLLPISYTECELSADGISASGFGDAVTLRNSMVQAFAEAWERWWMLKLSSNPENVHITSSNGFAAGSDNVMACERARFELIDRAILMAAWRNQCGWAAYQPRTIKALLLRSMLQSRDWQVSLFQLRVTNEMSVICALARNRVLGGIFDSALCPREKQAAEVEFRVLRSILKSMMLQKHVVVDPLWTLPVDGSPFDHWKYYRRPENLAAFDFLDSKDRNQSFLEIHYLEKIEVSLLIEAGTFPAVAVARNPNWPSLCWGLNSIEGINRWPHPLA